MNSNQIDQNCDKDCSSPISARTAFRSQKNQIKSKEYNIRKRGSKDLAELERVVHRQVVAAAD